MLQWILVLSSNSQRPHKRIEGFRAEKMTGTVWRRFESMVCPQRPGPCRHATSHGLHPCSSGLLGCSSRALCRLFDDRSDRLWLRHIYRMAPFDLDHGRSGAFGHRTLGVGRTHPVFRRYQIPTGLCLPRWLAYDTAESFDTPWHLRVGHEFSEIWTDIRCE